jgi:ABC-type polysaccharide/polyol phosphate export permease
MLIPIGVAILNQQMLMALRPAIPDETFRWIYGIFKAFFPSPISVEYSFIFILLGVAWYFWDSKTAQCGLFAVVCLFSFLLNMKAPSIVFFYDFYHLFVYEQFYMFLALPFMLLFNGEKGRSMKWFFYAYYPLNIYILFMIGNSLMSAITG